MEFLGHAALTERGAPKRTAVADGAEIVVVLQRPGGRRDGMSRTGVCDTMRIVFRALRLALAVLLAAPSPWSWAASDPPGAALLAQGHAIAKKNCGRCHAIALSDRSADPRSPPLRELAPKYPLSRLEEALAEGIMVGHQGLEMPDFQLTPEQIEALLAYMDSVQAK